MDRFFQGFFEHHSVDLLLDDFGDYMLSGEDVRGIFGFTRNNNMYRHLDPRDKMLLRDIIINGTPSGDKYCIKDPSSVFITEIGLYKIVLRSRTKTLPGETRVEKAKRDKLINSFVNFVFYELLPSLRKTGRFSTGVGVQFIANNQNTDGTMKDAPLVPVKHVDDKDRLIEAQQKRIHLQNQELFILRRKKRFAFVAPGYIYLKILDRTSIHGKLVQTVKFGKAFILDNRGSQYRGADPTSTMDIYFPIHNLDIEVVEMEIRRQFGDKLMTNSTEIILDVSVYVIAFAIHNIIKALRLATYKNERVKMVFCGKKYLAEKRIATYKAFLKNCQTKPQIEIDAETEEDLSDDSSDEDFDDANYNSEDESEGLRG